MSATGRRCYVASPLGFTPAGRLYYRQVLLPALGALVEVVDPWSLTQTSEFADAHAAGTLERFVIEVGRRNARAIDDCTVLVAWLGGQEIDSGTAAEIGYAAARGVRCFGLRDDLRRAGEPGAVVNLQVQAFIELSGGTIAGDLDELITTLSRSLSPAAST